MGVLIAVKHFSSVIFKQIAKTLEVEIIDDLARILRSLAIVIAVFQLLLQLRYEPLEL